jgi:hypothetical protein
VVAVADADALDKADADASCRSGEERHEKGRGEEAPEDGYNMHTRWATAEVGVPA